MAKKSKTLSFVLELPLVVNSAADRVLAGRFEAGRRLFNVALNETLKRLDLMRQSKRYQAARAHPKGKARSDAFKACNERFGFSEYAIHNVLAAHRNASGLSDRVGAFETQKIGTRAFESVQEYVFGVRGRPRFKGKHRPLHSIEGKTNGTGIRWNPETGCAVWGKLVIPALLLTRTQDPYLHEALAHKTKYCRMVWRNVKGQRRWFLQLIQDGVAPAKYEFHAQGQTVGLDIGPSAIAIIADESVGLEQFAPSVTQPWAETRKLQRAQDRSRRATNPDNYHPNGVVKKGVKVWKKSERYKARQAKLADIERALAASRKRDHGELANKILGLGNVIKTETLSYKAFQRCYGRSVKVRAPGAFVSLLTRKAESAGGKLVELDTWRLRMSQYDHVLNDYAKKPLSLRWHRLGGLETYVQRDMYSAFLAKNATEGGHNPSRLETEWETAEPLLRAGLCLVESASGAPKGNPTAAIPSEQIARAKRFVRGLSRGVVAAKREPGYPSYARL